MTAAYNHFPQTTRMSEPYLLLPSKSMSNTKYSISVSLLLPVLWLLQSKSLLPFYGSWHWLQVARMSTKKVYCIHSFSLSFSLNIKNLGLQVFMDERRVHGFVKMPAWNCRGPGQRLSVYFNLKATGDKLNGLSNRQMALAVCAALLRRL